MRKTDKHQSLLCVLVTLPFIFEDDDTYYEE